jgi:ABC-type nitrate/sulfonate/bicarbonate transport system permease component
VVPSSWKIGAALLSILGDPSFYRNLGVTAYEVVFALLIGGVAGLATGILLGGSRFLATAFEPYLYYLGPTPKIIFFPIMIMWFGVGAGSKTAMGALSCFFPVALSAAAGMREIDKVLIRVGRSFRASTAQMVTKIYLPAMRAPMINGLRLGLGIAIIGVLLAETKLSNQGLGFMIIQSYTLFNMPRMYALLIIVFTLAALINAAVSRLNQISAPPRR